MKLAPALSTLLFVFILRISSVFLLEKCGKWEGIFSQINCTSKTKSEQNDSYFYNKNEASCIPKCRKYSEIIYKDCSNNSDVCAWGYKCDQRCGPDDNLKKKTCVQDSDCPGHDKNESIHCGKYCMAENQESCMAYHINNADYNKTFWSALKFKPQCRNDGTWQAKQCKGGVGGRCMCYDFNGTRIFGEALYKESENMTCACSRRKSDLISTGQKYYVSFHCDRMGNFEKLQCDVFSNQCWCVEPKTGDLTSIVVPDTATYVLPCYKSEDKNTRYLRQCESKQFAQIQIENKLKVHGVQYVASDFLLCDDDGSYGTYTIIKDNVYCTWRNNSIIGSWGTSIQFDIDTLDCNCARDYIKYDTRLICEANGNYEETQKSKGSFFCVDKDGFSKSEVIMGKKYNCTKYY